MADAKQTIRPPLMHERIKEQTELAVIYAEDGAYRSALRVLKSITEETRKHVARLGAEGIG